MSQSDDPTEEQVCDLWERQLFDKERALVDGQSIHVVFAGWRNGGAGPDFQDAIIQLGNGELRYGAVEVHVRSSGWRDHGHEVDPRYDGLALHVVWRGDNTSLRTRNGATPPTLELRPCTDAMPPATVTPPKKRLLMGSGSFVCPGRVESEYRDGLWNELGRIGEERLLTRAAELEGDMEIASPEQVWYQAVLEALGYSQNTEPFKRLARTVPMSGLAPLLVSKGRTDIEHDHRADALLLGAAGALPEQRPGTSGAAISPYALEIRALWRNVRDRCSDTTIEWNAWRVAGVRPANHPVRRIAAIGELVSPVADMGLIPWLRAMFNATNPGRVLISPVVRPSSYWATHLDFGRYVGSDGVALVGRRRMVEIAVNATLPAAVAVARSIGDEALERDALRLFHVLPALGDNGLARRILAQVMERPSSARLAAREQGLLDVYHRWCRRKQCWNCPIGRLRTDRSGGTSGEFPID